MQLFEVEELTWDKVASVELEEDATQWPRQVLTELFRALPEISEYTPEVKFLKTNEEQGYAIGVVVVSNGTNSAIATTNSAVEAPRALIPLVIKNGKLSPLDTVMSSSGRMYPLTVDRLREVLYRPETFDLATDDWGDAGLGGLFAPPGQGLGGLQGPVGPQTIYGPGMKQAALEMDEEEEGPLLPKLAGTILSTDIEQLKSTFMADPILAKTAALNPAMQEYLYELDGQSFVDDDVEGLLKGALATSFPADVMLVNYAPEENLYEVKLANRRTGMEAHELLGRRDFLQLVGPKLAALVDREGGVVSAAKDERAKIVAGASGHTVRPIEHSGFYAVYNAVTGATLRGWVVNGLIDTEGNRLPICLFANELGATTQEQISGHPLYNERTALAGDPVKGQGSFVVRSSESELNATVPLTVRGSVGDQGAIRYNCIDITGAELTVVLQRGCEAIVAFPARKELILPHSALFVSTDRPMPPLVSKGEEEAKVASVLLQGQVRVTSVPGTDSFHLQLRQLPKLANKIGHHPDLSTKDTIYALCLAGLDGGGAIDVLQKVANTGRCDIFCEDMEGLPKLQRGKFASEAQEVRALRPNLLKEAASLTDSMTVDAVLGLDFINSENVRVFIKMVPYLEKALNKVCELVYASRLGLNEIPETAASRAARGLNDAIRGLKALALRQIEELP